MPGTDPRTLTVLVTGGTSGYGLATATRFAQAGAKVIVTGRRQERLDAFVAEHGDRAHALRFDVRDRDAAKAAVDSLPDTFAEVDVLVNNAGLALGLETAWEAQLDDWQTMIETNCTALVTMTRLVLPGMVARNRGHVVDIGSISGNWPYPGGHVYGATKAFVKQFSQNLRVDLVDTDVRVTNIEPGASETEFSLVRFKGDADKAAATYQGWKALAADDVAETVFWACTLPPHVNVSRIEVWPTRQAPAGVKVGRGQG